MDIRLLWQPLYDPTYVMMWPKVGAVIFVYGSLEPASIRGPYLTFFHISTATCGEWMT
jgi:hypothetical protein